MCTFPIWLQKSNSNGICFGLKSYRSAMNVNPESIRYSSKLSVFNSGMPIRCTRLKYFFEKFSLYKNISELICSDFSNVQSLVKISILLNRSVHKIDWFSQNTFIFNWARFKISLLQFSSIFVVWYVIKLVRYIKVFFKARYDSTSIEHLTVELFNIVLSNNTSINFIFSLNCFIILFFIIFIYFFSGKGEIRTRGTISTFVFKTNSLGHLDTLPIFYFLCKLRRYKYFNFIDINNLLYHWANYFLYILYQKLFYFLYKLSRTWTYNTAVMSDTF